MTKHIMNLPPELLDRIMYYLDVGPPSLQALHREPSITLTESDARPFKNLSLTSRALRRLTVLRLCQFSRICLRRFSLQDASELSSGSEDISDFLDFVRFNALRSHIKGLVLYTEVDLSTQLGPTAPRLQSDDFGNWGFYELAHIWRNLLTTLNPDFITIVAPPSTLAPLASCICKNFDAWAFDIPFHILHLQQARTTPTAGSSEPPRVADLFYLREWSHCTLNEGSSLKAYSTYEYYHKITPSIAPLGSLNLMPWITSFDYIAIFPLHEHTHVITRLFLTMPNLERLRIKLVPEPSNKILEDEARMGKALPADIWVEVGNGYYFMLHGTRNMGMLKHFESLDYAMEGLRPTIDGIFDDMVVAMSGWLRSGGGCWRRDSLLDPTPELVVDTI